MTALLGNRTPLSISETTVLDSEVGSRRVRISSERNDGLSALRWTVRKLGQFSLGGDRRQVEILCVGRVVHVRVPVRRCPSLSPSVRPDTRR